MATVAGRSARAPLCETPRSARKASTYFAVVGEGSAHSMTVLPWLSRMDASAPLDKRAWSMPRSPFRAAIIRAVSPLSLVMFAGAPVASSWRTTVSLPSAAAASSRPPRVSARSSSATTSVWPRSNAS